MTPTWASARDLAARVHCQDVSADGGGWDYCTKDFIAGADFGRASLLADLEASQARERKLRDALSQTGKAGMVLVEALEFVVDRAFLCALPCDCCDNGCQEAPCTCMDYSISEEFEKCAETARAALAAGKTCEGEK